MAFNFLFALELFVRWVSEAKHVGGDRVEKDSVETGFLFVSSGFLWFCMLFFFNGFPWLPVIPYDFFFYTRRVSGLNQTWTFKCIT